MDLRKYSPSPEQIEKAKTVLTYQPFTLSDSVCTGTANQWVYPERFECAEYLDQPRSMCLADKNTMPIDEWEEFNATTVSQRVMYDDWIDSICRFLPDLSDLTMVDVACAEGYFPVSFALKGVREAHGYDMEDNGGAFDLLNTLTGSNAKFHHKAYNSMTHTIDGIDRHDIVVASAIMEHVSDPLYFLNFVSSICKRLLLIFLPTIDTKELTITYNETESRHCGDASFPVCFDSVKLSPTLVYRSLEMCGFKKVVELFHKDSWVPMSFYKGRRVFIALR
jgi:2-polyprenyl-3-methyl-5-hydroxy-6-metoxy-1,4-benzoquinol methylase